MQVYQAAGSGLEADALVNNAIGRMAVSFQSDSATAGVRNLGLSFGTGSAIGLYTVAWPTTTARWQNGTINTTQTYGQFGTDTNRPPHIAIQGGSIAALVMAAGFVNSVNTAGATLSLVGISQPSGIMTNSGISMGVVAGTAGAATIYVYPCTMSALNAQTFTFNTTTA